MKDINDWQASLQHRYPLFAEKSAEETNEKSAKDFRNYAYFYSDSDVNRSKDTDRGALVNDFYRKNHRYQTYDFVCEKEAEFLRFDKKQCTVWQALDFLNTLIDDSDPDIELDQLQHLMQTSEAIRADGHPDWFVLTGLLHDLGKVLCLFDEPQWAVVGDTFPVGCAHSDKIVYADFFQDNPDYSNPKYNHKYGIYKKHCGLENVKMSWGHDEYLYQILKDNLPEPALYIIRYHSFYAQHQDNAYAHLMNEKDVAMFEWVKKFNPYDLYSKSPVAPNVAALRPYYEKLIAKYLPTHLNF